MFSMYDTLSWRRAYSQSAGTKNVSCIGSIHHRLSSPVFFRRMHGDDYGRRALAVDRTNDYCHAHVAVHQSPSSFDVYRLTDRPTTHDVDWQCSSIAVDNCTRPTNSLYYVVACRVFIRLSCSRRLRQCSQMHFFQNK